MNPSQADDPAFAELFDELLQQLLEGAEPDLEQLRRERPQLAHRIDEAHAMACAVAGRREPATPTLGGYQIVRELGRGGMGTVYLARHEALDREVALKVLPVSLGLSQKSRRRFHEETRALARLQHDHIVRIHRVVENGDLLAFEMEYVEGASLRRCIDHLRNVGAGASLADLGGLLDANVGSFGARTLVDYFVRIGVQVGRALDAAHRAGIVHRDVKPANVLLRRDGRALLVDFGLALGLDPDLTRRGDFVGTPTYAPPEQLRAGDDAVDARADVYSLGITLYEAIALAPPISGRSTTDLLRRIDEGRLVPLRQRAPNVSRDLETILQKAMEREPKDRYATAAEFADDLDRLLRLQPIHARPASVWRRATKFARRNARTLLAAGLGALLVALAMVPIVNRIEAAQQRRVAAGESVGRARLDLLRTCSAHDWRLFALAQGPRVRHVEDGQDAGHAIERVRAAYAAALANGIDDPAVRSEHDVVRLLAWLRLESPTRVGDVDAAMASPGFAAAVAPLPPLTATVARSLVARSLVEVDVWVDASLPSEAATATAEDCRSLGLLYFLIGDYVLAEKVWTSPSAAAAQEDPVVDVGLGMLYLADGRSSRAYLRLLRGTARMPASAEFDLLLADAALAMDDPDLAAQWFSRVDPAAVAAPVRRHADLLRGDLASATGDNTAARAAYQRLHDEAPTDPLPRYRLAQMLAAAGDLRGACRMLVDLTTDWPDVARVRLDLARLALQLGDVPLYLHQACYSVRACRAGHRSTGANADLLLVLYLGGLDRLYAEALVNDPGAATRATALRRPVAALLSRAVGPIVEDLVLRAARITTACSNQTGASNSDLARISKVSAALMEHAPGLLGAMTWSGRVTWGGVAIALAGQRGDRAEIRIRQVVFELLQGLGWRTGSAVLCIGDADPNLQFGAAFTAIADVDGDDTTDLLIGSTPCVVAQSRGKVEVVSGRSGQRLVTMLGSSPDRLFGFAVASPGDIDGDGHADWLVGAPLGASAPGLGGTVQVFSGADGHRLREIDGPSAGFGVSVTGIGDWNRDGVPDFAVGVAPELRSHAALGKACVYSGRDGALLHEFPGDSGGLWFGALVANVGDVDGDGRDDLAVAGNFGHATGMVRVFAAATGAELHTWIDDSTTGFGESVCGAGDLDGDGSCDLLVTAPGSSDSATGGYVFVLSGRDGRTLRTLRAGIPGDRFGQSVTGGVDIDGDRVPDLVVSAQRGGGAGSGIVRVYSGRTGQILEHMSNLTPATSFANSVAFARFAGGTHLLFCNSERDSYGSVMIHLLRLPSSSPNEPR